MTPKLVKFRKYINQNNERKPGSESCHQMIEL